MTFQPLPPPFQPTAKVYAVIPSNPLPTPVFAHPHTPKVGTPPFEGVRHLNSQVQRFAASQQPII